jgi:hypothetical protein
MLMLLLLLFKMMGIFVKRMVLMSMMKNVSMATATARKFFIIASMDPHPCSKYV